MARSPIRSAGIGSARGQREDVTPASKYVVLTGERPELPYPSFEARKKAHERMRRVSEPFVVAVKRLSDNRLISFAVPGSFAVVVRGPRHDVDRILADPELRSQIASIEDEAEITLVR